MKDEPEIVKELKKWEKNHTSRNNNEKNTNKHRSSLKLFEDVKKKQEVIPHITLVAMKSLFIGINLTLLIELYFIIFIENITTFEIIINISLTIIVFFIATAYLLHHLEKTSKEIKDAHEIIETLIKNLEIRIKNRTTEIRRLLMQKDEFINCLSHDLKSPLVPLMSLLPILEKKLTDSESKEIIKVLNRNVIHIKNLVEKNIQLAQISSPDIKIKMEDTNLLNEVNNVIKKNKFILMNNKIVINNVVSDKINVKADKLKLNELLDNIINNSIKYSKNSCKITINATQSDKFVTVSIKDTGIGMTKEQINQVFNEFYKADNSRHDFDSSGLGMSICKRIIERHGGCIWAESDGLEKGSTFFFTIPKLVPIRNY